MRRTSGARNAPEKRKRSASVRKKNASERKRSAHARWNVSEKPRNASWNARRNVSVPRQEIYSDLEGGGVILLIF